MRSSLAFATLLGAAAASPFHWRRDYGYGEYQPYPTGGSPSSSASEYLPSTPVSTSSGTAYVPSSTNEPASSSYSSSKSVQTPTYPLPTGYPSNTELTTYTTTTVCPVTETYGTQIVTTMTTSVITVTSCKGGCSHQPTPVPTVSEYPTGTESPIYVPTTITRTTYSFVPCSTSVGHNGPSVIYSTYLTASYYETTLVSTATVYPTMTPVNPTEIPETVYPTMTVYPVESVYPTETPELPNATPELPNATPELSTATPALPTDTPQQPTLVPVYPVESQCPAPAVVTVTVTAPAPSDVPGYPATIVPEPSYSSGPEPSPSSGPEPSSSSEPGASPTGYVPYPTNDVMYPIASSSSAVYEPTRVGPKPTAGAYGYKW